MSKAASPRILSLEVRAVRVPMSEPHRTASGEITGVRGHSMVFTYAVAALAPTPS
jgi:hypothetical protein